MEHWQTLGVGGSNQDPASILLSMCRAKGHWNIPRLGFQKVAFRKDEVKPCTTESLLSMESHLFSRARKKIPFFFCGATTSRTDPKTQPLEVAYSLLARVDLTFQKEAILGRKTAWGRVRWTGKKREKGCAKKGGE